jgi:alpha-glucosidase
VRDVWGPVRRGWARARLGYRTVTDLGLRTTGQVIAHSVERRRATPSEWASRAPTGPPVEPGVLSDFSALPAGAVFRFARAELEVVFLGDDVVRLTWGPGPDPHPYAAAPPSDWVAPPVTLEDLGPGGHRLGGGRIELGVGPDGSIEMRHPDGQCLRRELPPRRRDHSWEHRFVARSEERFSGLGEQAAGLDLRGGQYRLWNRDPGGAWGVGQVPLYVSAPVLVCSHPAGSLLSFYDNPCSALVHICGHDEPDGEVSLTFAGGRLRQYLFVGDPPRLLDRYSALTGRPGLPPRWALGYHQSRWGYRSQRHLQSVLDGYRSRALPLSALHLDIDYMDGYRAFTVDRRRFPDLPALSARAASQGVRLVTIVDPAVKVDDAYPLYRQGVEQERFCTGPGGEPEIGVVWPGRAAFPDFTDPDTRQWWAGQYRMLADLGVGGVWHDMNEPTSISLFGDPTLPLGTRHHLEGRGGDHAEAHNLYGLLMNRAGHEGLVRARPGNRPFVLSRSGWAGNQRWAWNWTGDVETSWEGLRQQIATVVGLGLSGICFAGPDIGGFSGVPDPELYLRWLQLSVFLGLCRTHSIVGAPSREPWRFPEPHRRAVASWIRLRYRLLPYLYSLAHQASEQGAPLVRPRWWPAPGRPQAADGNNRWDDADDTFLLGDALLVAPVTAPAATVRQVRLPSGQWHAWWDEDRRGPVSGAVEAQAPIGRIPVFARGGSIVALDDGWAEPGGACALKGDDTLGSSSTPLGPVDADHAPRLLAFHCWPHEGAASGWAFDDAGDGDGPARRDRLVLSEAVPGGEAVLRWDRQGEFPAPARVRVVMHGFTLGEALSDGTPVDVHGGSVVCPPFGELSLRGLEPG